MVPLSEDMMGRYRFFLEHAGYCTPPGRAACALALARAEARADDEGLVVVWNGEDIPWDGDGPPPPIWMWAGVVRAEDAHQEWGCMPAPKRGATYLASLGGIGLNGWRDPYVRVVSAELLAEALDVIDAEAKQARLDVAPARATRTADGGAQCAA